MKTFSLITIIILSILSCKNGSNQNDNGSVNQGKEISIQVKVQDKEDIGFYENDLIPWISIKDPFREIPHLKGQDEIIIDSQNAILIIDYPIKNPVEINIKSKTQTGFSRKELVEIISREYNRIYKEEDESSAVTTIPKAERQSVLNRNTTAGKYGIWGHDLDDLDLSAIIIKTLDNGEVKIELVVES